MDDFSQADSYLNAGDGASALPILYRLAEQGSLGSMHAIAHTHLYGLAGIHQDYAEAFRWFSRGAKLACPQAMYHLGLCYAMGYGTDKNPVKSLKWYLASAYHGDSDAMFQTGNCYEQGLGTTLDLVEAKKWYHLAADRGQEEALKRIE